MFTCCLGGHCHYQSMAVFNSQCARAICTSRTKRYSCCISSPPSLLAPPSFPSTLPSSLSLQLFSLCLLQLFSPRLLQLFSFCLLPLSPPTPSPSSQDFIIDLETFEAHREELVSQLDSSLDLVTQFPREDPGLLSGTSEKLKHGYKKVAEKVCRSEFVEGSRAKLVLWSTF